MQPGKMVRVVAGKRYSTETATQIASDAYWDGRNWERRGRNTFLFRTPSGRYFQHTRTQWQGELDSLEPLDIEQAQALYEELPEHDLGFEDAFPGVPVEEA